MKFERVETFDLNARQSRKCLDYMRANCKTRREADIFLKGVADMFNANRVSLDGLEGWHYYNSLNRKQRSIEQGA